MEYDTGNTTSNGHHTNGVELDQSSNDSIDSLESLNGNDNNSSIDTLSKDEQKAKKQEEKKQMQQEFDADMEKQRYVRLSFLLEKTSLYSNFLSQKLSIATDGTEEDANKKDGQKENGNHVQNGNSKDQKGQKKRKRNTQNGKSEVEDENQEEDGHSSKKGKNGNGLSLGTSVPASKSDLLASQPKLITGGSLRAYQLRGVEWLISLYENGLNGILADEMGLGKTIQCISLLAHLIDNGVKGPFLIVGPLSTLSNWMREFERWAPAIPAVMYHGNKDERTQIRSTKLINQKKIAGGNTVSMMPIVITSYEIVMNDRRYLQKYKWKYIIVDEGHRIKNLNCKLIRELKSIQSANRLLLTGTPLQNNLTELWSLLNFLLPDIFDDLSSFQSWFDFSSIGDAGSKHLIIEKEQQGQIVTKLHQILRPFLLRRVKEDVEIDIPKKQEKIIHTKLTQIQHKYYKATIAKELESVLSEKAIKQLRNKGTGLQNMLMQLRKACNHPYLFEWPTDKDGNDIIDEEVINSSGKIQVLDRILARMRKEGNKVLIFSQMTRMLDILEDYMAYRGYTYTRLDGSSAQTSRQESIEQFTTQDVFCFLLSTRAGGLGINLTAANVVIFFDNDWNPQADLQAQDRCHRIGQTKPVQIYRLATANSVESKILERANSKMKLDRLVIQKGNFVGAKSKSGITEISEIEQILSDSPALAGHADEITDDVLFSWADVKVTEYPRVEDDEADQVEQDE